MRSCRSTRTSRSRGTTSQRSGRGSGSTMRLSISSSSFCRCAVDRAALLLRARPGSPPARCVLARHVLLRRRRPSMGVAWRMPARHPHAHVHVHVHLFRRRYPPRRWRSLVWGVMTASFRPERTARTRRSRRSCRAATLHRPTSTRSSRRVPTATATSPCAAGRRNTCVPPPAGPVP